MVPSVVEKVSRNWRVNWVRGLPSGLCLQTPRQVILEVVTDFGERVGEESFEGYSVHVDLSGLSISLSLHQNAPADIADCDDVWAGHSKPATPGSAAPSPGITRSSRIDSITIEAFSDMDCSRPLDSASLSVDPDGCTKCWLRLSGSEKRLAKHGVYFRTRARCSFHGEAVHPGGGMIISAWSPTCVLLGDDGSRQRGMTGSEVMQARGIAFRTGASPLPLWLHEDVRTRSTGGCLWDVAMVIGELAAGGYTASTGRLTGGWQLLIEGRGMREGARVIELGAGTGAVGLLSGMAGAGEVVFTDNDDAVLALLAENAQANLGKRVPWSVRKLVWGGSECRDLGKFDLVVASECLYAEEEFYPLCRTLQELTSVDSRVVLGFRSRDRKAEGHIRELLSQNFVLELCPAAQSPHPLPPFCSQDGIEIYALRLRQVSDPPAPPLSAYAKYLVAQSKVEGAVN